MTPAAPQAAAYDRLRIYYFSGTGNALTAARWVRERTVERGVDVELIPIDRLKHGEPPAGKRVLVGFHFPTHGFTTPWCVIKFLARFPRRRGGAVDVYVSNSRAGTNIGRLFIPGVSGTAALVPLVILALKGYRVGGAKAADLPSNWLQFHPGFTAKAAEAMLARRRPQFRRWTDRIVDGRASFEGWGTFILDIAFAPISPGYLLVGRFWLAKMQMASWACDGCALCERLCPVGAIELRRGRPYWTHRCEACMRCLSVCPWKAVESSHLYLGATITAYVYAAGALMTAAAAVAARFPVWAPLVNALYAPVRWLAAMAIIMGGYALLAPALRLKPLNQAFTYTALTRYWRRYLAPGIRPPDFRR
jgi:ferredoxin